jgi:hypothetical protein
MAHPTLETLLTPHRTLMVQLKEKAVLRLQLEGMENDGM